MCLPGRPLVKVHSKQWLAQLEEHHTAAVQFKGAEWEFAVGRGKEVGGEQETNPAKIFKHIRGMAIYLKPQN